MKIGTNNYTNYISKILSKYGINSTIISMSGKMDINLVNLFYEKIILSTNENLESNKSVIVKSLLGIYGNYLATMYYKTLGYKVENEYPVYDKENNLITKADLYFEDKNNVKTLCEVKLASQILDNIRNYKEKNEALYKDNVYFDKDDDIIKYKMIGSKLLKQARKLKSTGYNVNIVIFSGCYMDDIIKDTLSNDIGVNIKIIDVDVDMLKDNLDKIVSEISKELRENIMISDQTKTVYYGMKVA